jgi:TRAP-type C4-dicarboxylate transport system permease small subunit
MTVRTDGRFARLTGWFETAGAACLFAMMAVTFLDIVGRFAINRPLPGSTDFVQVLLALTAAFTLPAITLRGEHLSIGLFDNVPLTPVERMRRLLVAAIGAVVFIALSLLLWRYAGETQRNADVIGYLRVPVYPIVYTIAVLAMVAGAAFAFAGRLALRAGDGADQNATLPPRAVEPGAAK